MLALGIACALPPATMGQVAPDAAKPKSAQQQKKPSAHKHHRKTKAELATEQTPAPTVAPNMLDQPATPATVTTSNDELTVKAQNSSLSQILRQVSSQTGMKLDGMSTDERVFGSFGPGAPREVLTALLNGTSYNLIMVGDLPNGAPRELLLSRRSGGAATPNPAVAANATPAANAGQDQEQPNPDENPPEDNGGGDDNSDDSAPPMQYTPPSITPSEGAPSEGNQQQPQQPQPEGVAPTPRTIPMQPPQQQ